MMSGIDMVQLYDMMVVNAVIARSLSVLLWPNASTHYSVTTSARYQTCGHNSPPLKQSEVIPQHRLE